MHRTLTGSRVTRRLLPGTSDGPRFFRAGPSGAIYRVTLLPEPADPRRRRVAFEDVIRRRTYSAPAPAARTLRHLCDSSLRDLLAKASASSVIGGLEEHA